MQQLMTMIIAMNGGHMVYGLDTYGQMYKQTDIQLLHSPTIVMTKRFLMKFQTFTAIVCFNKRKYLNIERRNTWLAF